MQVVYQRKFTSYAQFTIDKKCSRIVRADCSN